MNGQFIKPRYVMVFKLFPLWTFDAKVRPEIMGDNQRLKDSEEWLHA